MVEQPGSSTRGSPPGRPSHVFVGGLLRRDDVHDGVDERQVGEGLREVAEVAAGVGVDLLRGVVLELQPIVVEIQLHSLAKVGSGGSCITTYVPSLLPFTGNFRGTCFRFLSWTLPYVVLCQVQRRSPWACHRAFSPAMSQFVEPEATNLPNFGQARA